MISILIPIYNDSLVGLVTDLHRQCLLEDLVFEIICLDDGSKEDYRRKNAALNDLSFVSYKELKENMGRSRIRNRLAEMAQYPYLLFMDGDSKVVSNDYIRNYYNHLQPGKVIYGGRVYSIAPPIKKEYYFHWLYGKQREALKPTRRAEHPHRSFMTNNFVVPKQIHQRIRFDESIRRYGYEDTLYALGLKKAGVEILHLDNPLEHLGLEKGEVFLQKVEDALGNLGEILPDHPEIDTRLLVAYRKLRRWYALPLLKRLTPFLLPGLRQYILANQGPLKMLDIYKLGYFIQHFH